MKDIEKYNRITLKIEKSRICMFEYIYKIVLENTFIGVFQHDFFYNDFFRRYTCIKMLFQ